MTTKEFASKISTGYVWRNIGAMALVVIALLIAIIISIDVYTRHGKSIEIPKFAGHQIEDVQVVAEELGLRIIITDSIYNPHYREGCVLSQNPKEGNHVKPGRVIYLTVNTLTLPTLEIPDLIDNSSSREAIARLKVKGFKMGEIEYVPGERDWLIGIKCNGRQLATGDHVTINDVIILQVGDGRRDENDVLEVTDPIYTEEDIDEIDIDESGDFDDFEEI